MGIYYATLDKSTRMTPNVLMLGRETQFPTEEIWGSGGLPIKDSYDVEYGLTHYKPDDLVMYVTNSWQLDVAPKLRVNFQDPYLVLYRLGDLDYWVQLDPIGKLRVVHHDKLKLYVGEQGLLWAKSVLRAHKVRALWGPLAQRTQDGEMRVRASSCSPYRMTYNWSTCDYTNKLYHEMCTNVLQTHFEEKYVPLHAKFAGSTEWLRLHSAPTTRRITGHRQNSSWVTGSVCLHKTSCWGILCK